MDNTETYFSELFLVFLISGNYTEKAGVTLHFYPKKEVGTSVLEMVKDLMNFFSCLTKKLPILKVWVSKRSNPYFEKYPFHLKALMNNVC